MGDTWRSIPEFPAYLINPHGVVLREDTGKTVRPSTTTRGDLKIGLYLDGKQHWRSLPRIVAELFVEGCSDIMNTPMFLDLNKSNVSAENLVWRPKQFVRLYYIQHKDYLYCAEYGPVSEKGSKRRFRDIAQVSTAYGLLMVDVYYSCLKGGTVFPTGQTFVLETK